MKLVFKLIYTPSLSPGPSGAPWVERSHELHVFPSGDLLLSSSYAVSVIDVTHRRPKKISVFIADDVCITDTSGIGINAYCVTWGPQGCQCKATGGAGFLYIEEIAQMVSTYCSEDSGSLMFDVALMEHTSAITVNGRRKPVNKGRVLLELLVRESDLGKKIQIDATPCPFLKNNAIDGYWRQLMLNHCHFTIREINEHFLPSEPEELITPIRCPFYENDSGLLLPGSAYAWRKPRLHYDIALFDWLLQVALRRHKLTAADFMSSIASRDAFFKQRGYRLFSSVVSQMLSALTWALPYLPDFVNQNKDYPFKLKLLDNVYNEHYKATVIVLEGDCDGLAWLTNLMANQALVQTRAKSGIMSVSFRVLQLLQRHYVPMLVQGAVTVGNAADTKQSDDTSGLCCHTFQILMPLYMAYKCFRRVKQKIPGIEKVQPYYGVSDDSEAVLEVILNEGTAPCACLQQSAVDSSPSLRQHSARVERIEEEFPVLEQLQRLIYRHSDSRSFSMFYKSAVTAYCTYFYSVYDIPSFDLCFVRSVQSTQTYGITARELFTAAPTNALYMFNNLHKQIEEGVTLMDVIQGVMQRLEPLPLLLPPTTRQCTDVRRHVNKLLHSSLYNNLTSKSVCIEDDSSCDTVTYYCRLDSLNSELLQALQQLHERGALLRHQVMPLATTELQLLASDFPITAVDIELNLSLLET